MFRACRLLATPALVAAGLIAAAQPAGAAVTFVTSASNDAAFEGAGGFLQTYYGVPLVSGSALVPLERAVGQIRMSGQRRALYLPTAATGLPVTDGGTGVASALTNVPPYANTGTDFANGVPVLFSIKRIGDVVTYTVGSDILSSDPRLSMRDINAFSLRIRSNAPTPANPSNGILISDLVFSDSITTNQSLGLGSAFNGSLAIGLWEGIVGDFTLSGKYTVSWTGERPSGSALASQIKLLAVPTDPVPEPASWALLIAGFGLTGAALRQRRRVAA